MSTTLTYVGDHRLVSTAMTNLLRLSLVGDNQVEFSVDPRPLDLHHSALQVELKNLLLDSDRRDDWTFQDDLTAFLGALDDPDWKMVTLRHTMLYEVIEAEGDTHPSKVVLDRLARLTPGER